MEGCRRRIRWRIVAAPVALAAFWRAHAAILMLARAQSVAVRIERREDAQYLMAALGAPVALPVGQEPVEVEEPAQQLAHRRAILLRPVRVQSLLEEADGRQFAARSVSFPHGFVQNPSGLYSVQRPEDRRLHHLQVSDEHEAPGRWGETALGLPRVQIHLGPAPYQYSQHADPRVHVRAGPYEQRLKMARAVPRGNVPDVAAVARKPDRLHAFSLSCRAAREEPIPCIREMQFQQIDRLRVAVIPRGRLWHLQRELERFVPHPEAVARSPDLHDAPPKH
mmetsp:Transcript_1989/g.4554  ORF Transcript_1989/g.4554 Transcript_1989/m.4554 type:complete len:280 (-) Transcript_1989:985-1824(-)